MELDKIRAAIGDRTQREVAHEMGISEQYLSDILHNRRLISVPVAVAFERVLRLDALGLMYGQCVRLVQEEQVAS